MGPYCDYCGQRCFVPRVVPGSHVTILATCAKGAEHDRRSLGVDFRSARNPYAANQQVGGEPT